jgi:hypothetical protein
MASASSKKLLKDLNKKSKAYFQIDNNMPDFSKDPSFLAKHELAEKFIAEHGLPDSFKQKAKKVKSLPPTPKLRKSK